MFFRRAIRAAFKNKERAAILTTHYMEEADAVCDRVAILVSGQLRYRWSSPVLWEASTRIYFFENTGRQLFYTLNLEQN